MNFAFTQKGWEHYLYWQEHDPAILLKLNTLLKECSRSPFSGLGKPEPLRGKFGGWWSRRITSEHRLVYRVTGKGEDQKIEIAQCRHHY